MKNNKALMKQIITYIEEHLCEEGLNLNHISSLYGYSKYHLHRTFTNTLKIPMHSYVRRRRISEAARELVTSDAPIIQIALKYGYETQRSFSKAFKELYHKTPDHYRRRGEFLPLQLPYEFPLSRDRSCSKPLSITTTVCEELLVVGYAEHIDHNFRKIGKCWKKLHKQAAQIPYRTDQDFLMGINDYHDFQLLEDTPSFTYIAGAVVAKVDDLPNGMKFFTLPASTYVVFSYRGRNQDSMQDIIEYIYQEWFPASTCVFNDRNLYDFVKYGEQVDEDGMSDIQVWVSIL